MYHPLFDEWRLANPDAEKPGYFVSANDLTPLEHAKVQAIAQAYIDSSISKTVNAPNSHTIEDVKNLYMAAYDLGLKGVTYMRDGSRQGVLERIVEKPVEKPVEAAPVIPVTPRMPRPMMLTGLTYKTDSPSGKVYVTLNHDEKENLFEVFINHGKSGSDLMALADALGRMISFVLRIHSPVPTRERVREIISELTGIGGSRSVGFGENRVRSLPDAIAKVLARHYEFRVNGKVEDRKPTNGNGLSNGHAIDAEPKESAKESADSTQLPIPQAEEVVFSATSSSSTSLFDICPECGSGTLAYEEGCQKCYACGYSAC